MPRRDRMRSILPLTTPAIRRSQLCNRCQTLPSPTLFNQSVTALPESAACELPSESPSNTFASGSMFSMVRMVSENPLPPLVTKGTTVLPEILPSCLLRFHTLPKQTLSHTLKRLQIFFSSTYFYSFSLLLQIIYLSSRRQPPITSPVRIYS